MFDIRIGTLIPMEFAPVMVPELNKFGFEGLPRRPRMGGRPVGLPGLSEKEQIREFVS